jgi:hypothetical protein
MGAGTPQADQQPLGSFLEILQVDPDELTAPKPAGEPHQLCVSGVGPFERVDATFEGPGGVRGARHPHLIDRELVEDPVAFPHPGMVGIFTMTEGLVTIARWITSRRSKPSFLAPLHPW